MVALHVLGPYVLARLYTKLRRKTEEARERLNNNNDNSSDATLLFDAPAPSSLSSQPSFWTRVLAKLELPTFDSLIDQHLRPIHLAAFYLTGRYYHTAKRIVGIRYVSKGFLNITDD
jgi:peroxin-10